MFIKSIRDYTKSQRFHVIIVSCILLYVLIYHILYARFDGRTIVDHDFCKTGYYSVMPLKDIFQSPSRVFFALDPMPLVGLIMNVLRNINALNPFSYHMVGLVFYFSLIIGCYVLGRQIGGNQAGALSAFIAATLPIFDNMSKQYHVLFHAACIMIWAYVVVLNAYKKQKFSGKHFFWLGLVLLFSFYTHYTAAILAVPFYLYLIFLPFHLNLPNKKKYFLEYSIFLTVLLVVTLPYFFHVRLYNFTSRGFFDIFDDSSAIPPLGIRIHTLWSLSLQHFGFFYFFFFALPAALLIIRLIKKREKIDVFLSYSLLSLVIYFLYITMNGRFVQNGLNLYVLLVPYLIGSLFLWRRELFCPETKLKKILFTVIFFAVLVFGFHNKEMPVATYGDETDNVLDLDFIRTNIFMESALGDQIAKQLKFWSETKNLSLNLYQLEYPEASQSPINIVNINKENDLSAFIFLLQLYGLYPEIDQDPEKSGDVFEIIFDFPLKRGNPTKNDFKRWASLIRQQKSKPDSDSFWWTMTNQSNLIECNFPSIGSNKAFVFVRKVKNIPPFFKSQS